MQCSFEVKNIRSALLSLSLIMLAVAQALLSLTNVCLERSKLNISSRKADIMNYKSSTNE